MVPEEASAPDPSMGVAVEARSKVMDSEDEGIFLFGSSKQKLVTISDENKTNVNTLFASSEDKSVVPETWNSVPRIRSALPRQCSKDLIKDVIITGEEIKRWATIYAKTVSKNFILVIKLFLRTPISL